MPDTITWHLATHHGTTVSRSTVHRILTRAGLITPEPKKRPKSSYTRFAAEQPNQTWQSDFTHYRLTRPEGTPGVDAEIITWLDDHSRYVLHASGHARITAQIVLHTFRTAADQHGYPASTLTDNGMVYTVRFATGRGGRTALENELRAHGIVQKNSRPNHPTTCGKVERFQQTMKNWLRAQPHQPDHPGRAQHPPDPLRARVQHRPPAPLPAPPSHPRHHLQRPPQGLPEHRPHRDTHDRVRTDKVYKNGTVTLRHHGVLHTIGIGRTHARTHILMLVQDTHIRIVHATTGELLRELILDPNRTYHGTGRPPGPQKSNSRTHKT